MKKLLLMSLLVMLSFNHATMAAESDAADADARNTRAEIPAVLTDESLTTENAQGGVDCFYEENRAHESCASERQQLQRAHAF